MLIHAQMLRRGETDVVKLNRASAAIERSIKMQARLIDDLLDVSRITNGKFKIEFGTVDLVAVVRWRWRQSAHWPKATRSRSMPPWPNRSG